MGKRVLVFGSSSSLATSLINELLQNDHHVTAFSSKQPKSNLPGNLNWIVLNSYKEIGEIPDFDLAYIFNGFFSPSKFRENDMELLEETININLTTPMLIVYQLVQSVTDFEVPRNIVIMGSTSSYEGFSGSADYCAAKHGLVGFVRSLNQEFKDTNLRFVLFSTGTLDNQMGKKVVSNKHLLSEKKIAISLVVHTSETGIEFEPELIVKRRHI